MSVKLDGIAASVIANYPGIDHLTLRDRALTIASYLKTKNLTGIGLGREYHLLEHNFLGYALKNPEHNSLPLISAAIYCEVAQRLGLNAGPCGFPFHVHVIVSPPAGFDMDGNMLNSMARGEPMYIDPFRSEGETSVHSLKSQLDFLGASTPEKSSFLGESLTSEIVLRCAKNILNSVQHMSQFPTTDSVLMDITSAKYAAFWSSVLISGPSRPAELRHILPCLMEVFATNFPSDMYLMERYLGPLFRGMPEYEHILESLHVMRSVDEIPKQVHRRTGEHIVRYRIGQVFEHRRYHYIGIIIGWDTECGAGEQWMRRMGVDHLQAGRHQSFYHVLYVYTSLSHNLSSVLTVFSVEDKSVRYVAEENVELVKPHIDELPQALVKVAGKHFKRWDKETQAFISNIRDEYPED